MHTHLQLNRHRFTGAKAVQNPHNPELVALEVEEGVASLTIAADRADWQAIANALAEVGLQGIAHGQVTD